MQSLGTVLIVEDDVTLQRAYHGAIAALGRSVLVASGVRAAKRLVRRARPSLGLIDHYLVDGRGLELISWWRVEDPSASLVLMSGVGGNELGFAAARAGADLAIDKPSNMADIASCVQVVAQRGTAATSVSDERASYDHLIRVLAQCNGNKSVAARRLRRSRGWLERKLVAGRPSE